MPRQILTDHHTSARAPRFNQRPMRPDFYPVPDPDLDPENDQECSRCGATLEPDANYCVYCGILADSASAGGLEWLKARPWLAPRILAEVIDRLFPFLVIAPAVLITQLLIGWNAYFWTWLSVTFFWHLLRDCTPNRRSLGKRLFRLRVVSFKSRKRCWWFQAAARRFFSALSQTSYCIVIATVFVELQPPALIQWPWPYLITIAKTLLLCALGYDVISLGAILLSRAARRLEDFATRTCVIRENAFKRDRKKCPRCGALVSITAAYCGQCGERRAPKINLRPVD